MAMNNEPTNKFAEIGTPGLGIFAMSGLIEKAYNTELMWPSCYAAYNRIRRSDPEIGAVRQVFSAMTPAIELVFETPAEVTEPTDDDKVAVDFANSTLDDLEDIQAFKDTIVGYTPFLGWAHFEIVPAMRDTNWTPPDDDNWRSKYNDGLIGVRRFAFRDHSTFWSWDIQPRTGQMKGMWQYDPPNRQVLIPSERSIHLTFGDANNPEGLATLEAVYRLERIKYALEVVQGIGFEHAAGYLNVQKTTAGELSADDKSNIRSAARAIMSAQEGNYAAWPFGIEGEIKDVSFGAAPSILEAIRYYGLLKLALFNMQWIAQNTISGNGSYSSMDSASDMWLINFNAMWEGFGKQIDKQYGTWLFAQPQNKAAFPQITKRPVLKVKPIEKIVPLATLSAFVQQLNGIVPFGPDDFIAIRKKSGFLSDVLPDQGDATLPAPVDNTQMPEDDTPVDNAPAAMSQPSAADVLTILAKATVEMGKYNDAKSAA